LGLSVYSVSKVFAANAIKNSIFLYKDVKIYEKTRLALQTLGGNAQPTCYY